jgi:VWFA-related protein
VHSAVRHQHAPGQSRGRWPLLLPALAAAVLVPLCGVPSSAAQPPSFPSDVELVRLDVIVLDDEGRPVDGLTSADFRVEENGKQQAITTFQPVVVRARALEDSPPPRPSLAATPQRHVPSEGRCLILFIDDTHLGPSVAQQLRLHLVPFVSQDLAEGDWVTVVAPQAGVWWEARTGWERAQIPALLARIQGQYTRDPFHEGVDEYRAMEAVERPAAPHTMNRSPGGTSVIAGDLRAEEAYAVVRRRLAITLTALRQAVASLAGFAGHKSLVLYSQGFILAPRFPEFDDIVEFARRANVAVHFVDPRGLESGCATADSPTAAGAPCGAPATARRMAVGGAMSIAEATGGRDSLSNDPVLEVRRILAESRAYYLVGYAPSDTRPGQRRVRVSVLRDGLHVVARKRYVRRSNAAASNDSSLPAVLRSVSDADAIPLRGEVHFPGSGADASAAKERPALRTSVAVVLEVPAEPAGGRARRYSVLVEGRPRDRGKAIVDRAEVTVMPGASPARFERRFELSPGVWQIRAVALDLDTGRLGSILLSFETPD